MDTQLEKEIKEYLELVTRCGVDPQVKEGAEKLLRRLNNPEEEKSVMELFALMNGAGQFMRAKGFSGSGKSWVDGIKTARIYTSIGPAKSQVTYWKKNFQQYECPKIVVLEATIKEVLDQSERVSKIIKKQKQDKINSKKSAIQDKIRSLTEELNQLMK